MDEGFFRKHGEALDGVGVSDLFANS
jgi:hypothetical protein